MPATRSNTARAVTALPEFGASDAEQARFAARVAQRRTSRAELPTLPGLLYLGGGVAAAAFAALLQWRGSQAESGVAWTVCALHGLLTLRAFARQRALSRPDAVPEPDACHRGPDGRLVPVLAPQERILAAFDADGPERKDLRLLAGAAFTLWGVLLAGLPYAMLAGASHPLALVLGGAAAFFGTALAGRGVRTLLSMEAVERFVITNERTIALAGPGAALSIPHHALVHRPLVVGRAGGRASLALALRPLASVSPLPGMALIGLHDVDESRARDLAATVMAARREQGGGTIPALGRDVAA